MKEIKVIVFLFLLIPAISWSSDFLGLPIPTDSKIILKNKGRLEFETDMNHDQCLRYYKDVLKDAKDIKIREWKSVTYIEDDGKLPWHSITISKNIPHKTLIVIVKDNWTWIMGTLLLRYIGVFVVLIVLYISMSIAGSIASKLLKDKE